LTYRIDGGKILPTLAWKLTASQTSNAEGHASTD